MSNQEGVHAAVRSYTGTALDYLSDWHALFTTDGIAAGPWNSRMLAWINQSLGTAYSNLNEAKTAFAVSQGFDRWQDMNTFVTGPLIALSGATIAEDAAVGAVIGTLSVINGSGSYTFTITADPDSKFAIDGSDLETGAALDYETATFHTVTIEADNGVDPVLSRTFTVIVTDVTEGAGPTGDGIQLEDGFFLLAENGDYLIQEAA